MAKNRKILSVHEQNARIRMCCPTLKSKVRDGALVVDGNFQPTSRSAAYHVHLEYRVGNRPDVSVVSPKLERRNGILPHIYPGDKLCLYYPGSGEWTPDKSLALTIIPWIAEWLFHYEIWLVTGKWCGGGVVPVTREPIRGESHEQVSSSQS